MQWHTFQFVQYCQTRSPSRPRRAPRSDDRLMAEQALLGQSLSTIRECTCRVRDSHYNSTIRLIAWAGGSNGTDGNLLPCPSDVQRHSSWQYNLKNCQPFAPIAFEDAAKADNF